MLSEHQQGGGKFLCIFEASNAAIEFGCGSRKLSDIPKPYLIM
jgi:hypothetical protein